MELIGSSAWQAGSPQRYCRISLSDLYLAGDVKLGGRFYLGSIKITSTSFSKFTSRVYCRLPIATRADSSMLST